MNLQTLIASTSRHAPTPAVLAAGDHEAYQIDLALAMVRLREEAGLTQAALAEKLGVQQAAVAKLESARSPHHVESVMRYLAALGARFVAGVQREATQQVDWVTEAKPAPMLVWSFPTPTASIAQHAPTAVFAVPCAPSASVSHPQCA